MTEAILKLADEIGVEILHLTNAAIQRATEIAKEKE